MSKQYHIQCEEGDVGEYVLLPGDPGRSKLIASFFDSAEHVVSNREYNTYTGLLDGVKVSVVSTGIGCPSTAIAVEELQRIGAKTFIRVGTCGGLQPETKWGDLVIIQSAVRSEGTSHQYVPGEYPATAHIDTLDALRAACKLQGHNAHVGISLSTDSFYSEAALDYLPLQDEQARVMKIWQKAGVMAAEMECAALFTIAAVHRLRAGAICLVVDEVANHEMPHLGEIPLDKLIGTAVEGLRQLIKIDSAVLAKR